MNVRRTCPLPSAFTSIPRSAPVRRKGGGDILLSTAKGNGWRLRSAGAEVAMDNSAYLGEPGQLRRGHQIILKGETQGRETVIKWALQKEGGR